MAAGGRSGGQPFKPAGALGEVLRVRDLRVGDGAGVELVEQYLRGGVAERHGLGEAGQKDAVLGREALAQEDVIAVRALDDGAYAAGREGGGGGLNLNSSNILGKGGDGASGFVYIEW